MAKPSWTWRVNRLLTKRQSGMKINSVVFCCQVSCFDQAFLDTNVAAMSEALVERIDRALRFDARSLP